MNLFSKDSHAYRCFGALVILLLALAAPPALAQRPLRIACVGDSITEGNANPDYLTNSWPQVLGRMLEEHSSGAYSTANFGRSGATLLHSGQKPYRNLDVYTKSLAFAPDVVVINLGTNDAADASWSGDVADFERDLRELLRDYRALATEPRLLLSNLTPMFASHPKTDQCAPRRVEIEALLEHLGKELGLEVVDLKTSLVGKPELLPDGLHPNSAGNELLAAAVFEALVGEPAPSDESLRPRALPLDRDTAAFPVRDGKTQAARAPGWSPTEAGLEGAGSGAALVSTVGIGAGDFHLRAHLRLLHQENSAAGFAIGSDFFGFEGAAGTLFRNGPNMLGLRLLHPAELLWKRDAWIDFEVIRNGGVVWFLVDGFVCEMAPITGPIQTLAFKPMRSRMQVAEWSLVGDLVPMRAESLDRRSKQLPWVDAARGGKLAPDEEWSARHAQGLHFTNPDGWTILREDGSAFCVGPTGFSRGGDHLPHRQGPTVAEMIARGESSWLAGAEAALGDWSAFPGVEPVRAVCTPLEGRAPLLCLVEDASGAYNTFALESRDEGRTWSNPIELPAAVVGSQHMAATTSDGRLALAFIDGHSSSPTCGDFVFWVGTHDDLLAGREGQWTARLFPAPLRVGATLEIVGLKRLSDGSFATAVVELFEGERRVSAMVFSLAELEARLPTRGFDIPLVDLDGDDDRHVVVDREAGQYLGHVTTSLLPDGETILAVYPKGHGSGPIVYKRSPDGGRTWSERLPTPASWETSREVPTIHRLVDPRDGTERLILWSGLYPARRAFSEDDGATWSELEQAGDWGGIVVMGFVEQLKDGSYLAMFHDDGRFFREGGRSAAPVVFSLYQTRSADGGMTWSEPETVWSGTDVQLCEPGAIRSPDGETLAVLLRENSRTLNSHVIFSTDEARTWSPPRELPAALTGDRHTAKYAPDGRLFLSFRDTAHVSPTQGDWVGWVGTFDDIVEGRQGQYRVRLKDNKNSWDTTYPGVEVLPDGTFVVTTYGHWEEGQQPYILSARFTLDELDARAALEPSTRALYKSASSGAPTYRIPALVTTNSGTLLAACDARLNSGADLPADIDTVIRRSTDDGRTWGTVQTVYDVWSPEGERQAASPAGAGPPLDQAEGTADPCLLVDRDTGRIWCAVTWARGVSWHSSKAGYGIDSFHDLLLHSDDDGLTWSDPLDVTAQLKDPAWRSAWFSPGVGLQSRTGRLLLPFSAAQAEGPANSYAAISDDHGATWRRVGPLGRDTNECMLAELPDGRLVANLRSTSGHNLRAISHSSDNGETWTPSVHDDELIEPVCQASLLSVPAELTPDGRDWLVFCNPASTKRESLTLKVSFDHGETWPVARVLHAGPAAYSCLTLLADGGLGVLYERGDTSSYEGINFARVPLEWLIESTLGK